MSEEKLACVTLDLENDWYFDEPGYDHLTLEYLDDFIKLIDGLDIPLTVFVVGKTLERFPTAIDRLDTELDCEFHLHSYQHDTSKEYDFRDEIRRGKEAFRQHFGSDPIGYRAPQWNICPSELQILNEEGFAFDSSVLPSYRPGVYQNLKQPLEPYIVDGTKGFLEISPGVLPGFRIPLVHSYAKLLGGMFSWGVSLSSLPEVVVYTIHLHDLYRTKSFNKLSPMKRTIYERNQAASKALLRRNVSTILDQKYKFVNMTEIHANFHDQDGITKRVT